MGVKGKKCTSCGGTISEERDYGTSYFACDNCGKSYGFSKNTEKLSPRQKNMMKKYDSSYDDEESNYRKQKMNRGKKPKTKKKILKKTKRGKR